MRTAGVEYRSPVQNAWGQAFRRKRMSTAEPPPDGGSPAEGEPGKAASAGPGAGRRTPRASAAADAAAKRTAAQAPAARSRRSTAKAAPIAPEGEAPDIMD